MKKLSFFVLMFLMNTLVLSADCSYTELKELNTLSSYVETSYTYNESTGLFDLTVLNLGDKMYVKNEQGQRFNPVDGDVFISGLPLGSTYVISLISNENNQCIYETLRNMQVRIPYMNSYYKSASCIGHENLNVCNSRFLDYQISEATFLSLIQDNIEESFDFTEDDTLIEEELTFWEKVLEFVKKIYIPVILVVVSSGITVSIFSVIYRKIKHGL